MPRIVISGGGTGGHIFPAIAIADAIRARDQNAKILFVGAEGKMEMEKVPQAGYEIIGLPISGLQRSLTWKNALFPFKVLLSYLKAKKIIREFHPDVAVGVGGYASWPMLAAAASKGVATLIQEQNSYAGLANKYLAKKVNRICVAYDDMGRFFPADKLVFTGNPVREGLYAEVSKGKALEYFGLDAGKKTILVFGGSLGAGTLNEAMSAATGKIRNSDIQFIWQIGKLYAGRFEHSETARLPQVCPLKFIDRMDLAYAAADLTICRAGALTVSEICLLGKAAILVPSPNVAEDHQSRNADALVAHQAAVKVADADAVEQLIEEAFKLVKDDQKLAELSIAAREMAKPRATEAIVDEIYELI